MVEKAIGLLLKERRTTLDWSLDKAEKQTSIKKIYISALETENYSVFPGPFYVRAYLKQYSDRLELETEAVLDAYDNNTLVEVDGPFEDTGNYRFIRPDERIPLPSEQETEGDGESNFQDSKLKGYLPIVLLSSVAIIILLAVGLIVFFNYPGSEDISSDNYSLSTSSLVSSSSSSISSESKSSSSEATKEETELELSQDGTKVLLQTRLESVDIVFSLNNDFEGATATLVAPDTLAQTIELSTAGPSGSFKLENSVSTASLTVSNIAAVTITINGQKLDLSSVQSPSNTLGLEITYEE